MVEKIDEEKINEAEIPEDEISEESSDAKRTAEICLEKEEFQEFEDAKKDETAAAQAIQVEEPKKQSLTSALPSENIKQGTTANEEEEEKVKEVKMLEKEICLEKERPQEPEAIVDQETIVAQASITEESLEIETIGTVEKLDQGKRKEAENLEDEICEDSSARQTEDICLQNEEPNELHAVQKEGITSGQTFSEKQSDEQLHIPTSVITSEELEHETKNTEDEETIKDEISEDASDARRMEEICSQKERSIELEAVVEDEMTAGHTLTEKKSEKQVQNPTSALPSKERKEDEALAKDENASSQTLPTEKSEEQIPNPVSTLPSEEHKHETVNEVDKTEEEKVKEVEMRNEDSDGAKIVVEVCSEKDETRGAQAVLEGETIASQVIAQESEEKKIDEAELEDDIIPRSECVRELQGALEDGVTATQTLSVNENTETVEVEISNKNADDLHAADSLVRQSVEKENEKEEQVHEANGASKEKEENSEDVSDALQRRNSKNSEHIFTEAAATTDLKSETSELDKVNVKEVYLLDSEKYSESNEAVEKKQEGIKKELEDCTAEKPEPEDAMENIEDNSKQEETKEVCEGPKSIIKEAYAIIDESIKSTEEEMHESFQEDEKDETPEVEVFEKLEKNTVEDAVKQILEEEDTNKDQTTLLTVTMEEKSQEENTGAIMSIQEVCKESETEASGTGKENPKMEEHPMDDISNSSISDETPSNSNIEETDSTEETTLQNLEETAEPNNNDPSLLDIEKEPKEEKTAIEAKEDLVRSTTFELEESKKDPEEETPVKGGINTADLDSASPAAETEETNIKEAKTQDKKKEIKNVLAVEENGLATIEHEGIGVDSADIDVKPADSSTTCEKEKEIPQ
ncbi:hypothetical protein CRYUN_Cryun15aG0018400 [Craigia yunnanensis]